MTSCIVRRRKRMKKKIFFCWNCENVTGTREKIAGKKEKEKKKNGKRKKLFVMMLIVKKKRRSRNTNLFSLWFHTFFLLGGPADFYVFFFFNWEVHTVILWLTTTTWKCKKKLSTKYVCSAHSKWCMQKERENQRVTTDWKKHKKLVQSAKLFNSLLFFFSRAVLLLPVHTTNFFFFLFHFKSTPAETLLCRKNWEKLGIIVRNCLST